MIITSAYATLPHLDGDFQPFPIFVDTTKKWTGLYRVATVRDGILTATNPSDQNLKTWADESRNLLQTHAAGTDPHPIIDGTMTDDGNGVQVLGGTGTLIGNGSNATGIIGRRRNGPWYCIFEVEDPFAPSGIGGNWTEIWVGRFWNDEEELAETDRHLPEMASPRFKLEQKGVYYFYTGQGAAGVNDQGLPLIQAERAVKSVTFQTLQAVGGDSTSAAKEQGCTLDNNSGEELSSDWPLNE